MRQKLSVVKKDFARALQEKADRHRREHPENNKEIWGALAGKNASSIMCGAASYMALETGRTDRTMRRLLTDTKGLMKFSVADEILTALGMQYLLGTEIEIVEDTYTKDYHNPERPGCPGIITDADGNETRCGALCSVSDCPICSGNQKCGRCRWGHPSFKRDITITKEEEKEHGHDSSTKSPESGE